MPEQIKKTVEKRVFCAGFLSFSIGIFFFLQNYNGIFPALIPPFLIFFSAAALSSFSGRISEKKGIHFLYLLIFSGLLLYFRDPCLFALIGGFAAGIFSADAFASVTEKEYWHLSIRDYLAGGIFGVVFAANGFFAPIYSIPTALFLYALSVFCRKAEPKRSSLVYCVLFLFLISGFFYFTDFSNRRVAKLEIKKSVPKTSDPSFLRQLNMLSIAHIPLNKMLLILPDGSKDRELGKVLNVDHTVLFWGGRMGVHDQLSMVSGQYDLIILELPGNDFSMYTHQFIGSLKQKLSPHGVLICHLPDDDLLRAGGIRASLVKHFRFTKAGGGVKAISASDLPLVLNEKIELTKVFESVFYPSDWEQQSAVAAAGLKAPSDRDYMFERAILKKKEKNPVFRKYFNFLPLSIFSFSIVIAGIFVLYFTARYTLAYMDGMGFRLTALRNSFLFFFSAGFLFFSKTLGVFPDGLLYCAALQFLLLGCIFGCYIPVKYAYMGLPCLLALFVMSWFLMPYSGLLFTIGTCSRCFLAGGIFPLLLRRTEEKYKTGTVDPSDLFSSVCSGLFIAVLLLAMMP